MQKQTEAKNDSYYGFLEKEKEALLRKEEKELYACRGTKKCILRICEILCGERPKITENGNEVTLLFQKRPTLENKIQLSYFLERYKPVLVRFHLVFLEGRYALDDYCILEENAMLVKEMEGVLDDGAVLEEGRMVLM